MVNKKNEIIPSDEENESLLTISNLDTEFERDFQEVKNNLQNLLNTGDEAVNTAVMMLNDTQHPRAVEVFSGLLKNLAEINTKMLEIHKMRQEFQSEEMEEPVQQNTQNNIFVGSTAELFSAIQEQNEDEDV